MFLTLRITLGDRPIDTFSITRNATIGRDLDCDVVLDNIGISRKHSMIELMGNKAYVRDLDSSNGTFVGGSRVEREELRNGDVIQVGRFSMAVEYKDTEGTRAGKRAPPLDTIRTDFPEQDPRHGFRDDEAGTSTR